MQKVIPPGLNYGDIKPEAIENQIRIVKFTPIATIQSAKANDIVRFHLQGNGFFDPYSAYIKIRIQVDDIADPMVPAQGGLNMSGKFLDRSAHSLFQRLVIRSQGTELERIEQYDVMAAMINDMIYSQEQRVLHHYEGFAHRQGQITAFPGCGPGDSTTGSFAHAAQLLPYLCQQSAEPFQNRLGDYGAWKIRVGKDLDVRDQLVNVTSGTTSAIQTAPIVDTNDLLNFGDPANANSRYVNDNADLAVFLRDPTNGLRATSNAVVTATALQGLPARERFSAFKDCVTALQFLNHGQQARAVYDKFPLGVNQSGQPYTFADQFGIHVNPQSSSYDRITAVATNGFYDNGVYAGIDDKVIAGGGATDYVADVGAAGGSAAVGGVNYQGISTTFRTLRDEGSYAQLKSSTTFEFCIPIYSGIIGVLMPTKKLIPMSLLPLEIEFTMNPHAFYPVGTETRRSYVVNRFEIWSHTMFFEQELHRSLEAAVAEAGVFIHYNSFYLAPVNTYNATPGTLPQYNQIGVFLKSINSVHWTFLYNSYEQENGPRKLHFVCHNTNGLQLRNGMDLMPSEPLTGQTGGDTINPQGTICNQHGSFMIELYKAWNKMHDPLSDATLCAYNYNLDQLLAKPTTFDQWLAQNINIGTCQYGISLEGDELGMNKQMISGKKSVMPFDINIQGYKSQAATSYMMCFLRADFIIYVRPDLVVTRLGL